MFTVTWDDDALDELAAIWTALDVSELAVVAGALSSIHQNLTTDPFGNSESRDADVRVMISPPLGILFTVDGNAVTVTHVWMFQTPP